MTELLTIRVEIADRRETWMRERDERSLGKEAMVVVDDRERAVDSSASVWVGERSEVFYFLGYTTPKGTANTMPSRTLFRFPTKITVNKMNFV